MVPQPREIFESDQIAIVGTVKDVEAHLERNVLSLEKVIGHVPRTWFVVESNSTDATVAVLESLSERLANFSFQTLGRTNGGRIASIRNARQICHEWVAEQESSVTKVLVIDLDQDYSWEEVRFETSLRSFDGLFCHQDIYYDTFAFVDGAGRASLPKLPTICRPVRRLLNFLWFSPRLQLQLGALSEPLQVRSAFGGMAVYSRAAFESGHYGQRQKSPSRVLETCEHVTFNQSLLGNFDSLYIDPSFKAPVKNEHYRVAKFLRHIQGSGLWDIDGV